MSNRICFQDIVGKGTDFAVKDGCTTEEAVKHFFENIISDYNIASDYDMTTREFIPHIRKLSSGIYEIMYDDDSSSETVRYSVWLIFTMGDGKCFVTTCYQKRIKPDCAQDIEDDMDSDSAVDELARIRDNIKDMEVAHIRADEVLLSVIGRYVPRGKEIVKNFVSIGKWFS